MRTISQKELKEILEKHKKWVNGEDAGKRADLRKVNLSYADLHDVDLSHADLYGANLQGAYLSYADLQYTDLRYANLRDANLRDASLSGANLFGTDLRYVYRPWLVRAKGIGKPFSEIIYFADDDNVRGDSWHNYKGGTLAEFREQIDKAYPTGSKSKEHQRCRIEYLSAIKMFESMREAYIKSLEEEKDNENNI